MLYATRPEIYIYIYIYVYVYICVCIHIDIFIQASGFYSSLANLSMTDDL